VTTNHDGQRIVVTGGAGYIGSHTVLHLLEAGYDVVVIDDLSRGYRHNVEPTRLREVTLSDKAAVVRVLAEKPCSGVIHFAAYISVGESMKKPELYFQNNVAGSLSLLDAMLETGVKRIVFSSTAAVYGMPLKTPIPENLAYAPMSVYGESKVMVEKALDWMDKIHGLKGICLRYFNACGADPAGRRGEEHQPETHLIPLILQTIETGDPVAIFGDDYPTPDGTCVRDYIHVSDLATAHTSSMGYLLDGGGSEKLNVGTGKGFSVLEVIQSVERVTGKKVPTHIAPRRDGDPPELVADSRRLRQILGWQPAFTSLDQIVETAWNFEEKRIDP